MLEKEVVVPIAPKLLQNWLQTAQRFLFLSMPDFPAQSFSHCALFECMPLFEYKKTALDFNIKEKKNCKTAENQ